MNDINILFVDDEADILSAIKRMMLREKYMLHFSGNGADALNIMAKTPIHVIVSDMIMPEMDGVTLLRHVKERYPDTVRMVSSAYTQTNQLLRCINTGEIFRYITKPVNPDELRQALQDAIEYYLVRKDRISLVHELVENNEKLHQLLELKQKIEHELRVKQVALEESEKKYRTIIETAIEGVIIYDKDWRITYSNKQAAEMLGYADDDLLGKAFDSLIADDQMDDHNIQKMLRTQGVDSVYERCFVAKDGHRHWILVSAKAVKDDHGCFEGAFAMFTDINDRKLAETALKEANSKLESLSNIDGLTGIPNRRHFNERLMFEYDRLSRSRGELSLLLMDIDHFKDYNDCYGHIAGDDCLRRVAKAIENGISRAADFCARYGGEEFICILPETDRSGAEIIAEKIRCLVEELGIKHKKSKTADAVTISCGVVTLRHSPYETAIDGVHKADMALYLSKKNGRNRVTHFSTDIKPTSSN